MSNINTEGLPPEMQARIAEVIEKAKANAIQPAGQQAPVAPPPPAPIQRPPSLMDHIIALTARGRCSYGNKSMLLAQVTEAVGNAVGQFVSDVSRTQTEPTTYSSGFQEAQPSMNDDF